MPEQIYEVVALGARYWFILLGVIIVLRSFRWLIHDRGEKHRRVRSLPDAGNIGEFLVLEGNDELPEGSMLPVPWEGVLGFSRGNDVCVPVKGVAGQHCELLFEQGEGLIVLPLGRHSVTVDGAVITNRRAARENPMQHGSVLTIGGAVLRLRIFMGLETGRAGVPAEQPAEMPGEATPVSQPEWDPRYDAPAPGGYEAEAWAYDPRSEGAYPPEAYPAEPYFPELYPADAYAPDAYPREPDPMSAAPYDAFTPSMPEVSRDPGPSYEEYTSQFRRPGSREYITPSEQTWGMPPAGPGASAAERYTPEYLKRFARPQEAPSVPPVTPAEPVSSDDAAGAPRRRQRRRKEQS